MAQNRKLHAEIDRTLKRVAEGLLEFEGTWQKVYSAQTPALKEKHETDLKKEIKKLQRHRDQIKAWLASSEIRDKDELLTARRQIERDMERFKVCEKETKTKAFSKEALNNTPKKKLLDQPKLEVKEWIDNKVAILRKQLEEREIELDREQRRGKKKAKGHDDDEIDILQVLVEKYRFHINELLSAWEMLFEDEVQISDFDEIQEDVEYFIENNQEEEMRDFDDSYIYDLLKQRRGKKPPPTVQSVAQELEISHNDASVDIVVEPIVDSHTEVQTLQEDVVDHNLTKKEKKIAVQEKKDQEKKEKLEKKIAKQKKKEKTKSAPIQISANYQPSIGKHGRTPSQGSDPTAVLPVSGLPLSPVATDQIAFANVVKQQKLHAEQKAQQQVLAQAITVQPQQPKPQLQEQPRLNTLQHHHQQYQEPKPILIKTTQLQQESTSPILSAPGQSSSTDMILHTPPPRQLSPFPCSSPTTVKTKVSSVDSENSLSKLDESLRYIPINQDSERLKQYSPRNPYHTPSNFPSSPSTILEDPTFFDKYDTDTLFFIFYFQQGTYQQYLAARQLKRQSWRYHTKYLTWFQRHEDPQVTTDDYEQGTYVYFDYDHSWCQRIKAEFTFEYRYLEDELA